MSRRILCSFCTDAYGEWPLVTGLAGTTMGTPVAICQSCVKDAVNCLSEGIKRGYTIVEHSLQEQKKEAMASIRSRRK